MKRLLALLLIICCCAPSWASPFSENPKVTEAEKLIFAGKYVKGREIAEEVFKADPESFQSWYLMGLAMEMCEGNLPRAWFYYTGARDRLERQYGTNISTDGPWRMHATTLRMMASVAGQMEKYDEELQILAEHDKNYTPHLTAWYAWPLMKQGKYEESRAKIDQAMREQPDNENSVTVALNTKGAIEGEQGQIEESYKTFKDLIDLSKRKGWDLEATYYYNASEQAMELHKFREQEQLLIEATEHFNAHGYTNPWIAIAGLYLAEGRMAESIAAIRRMHDWSHRSEPRIEQQHYNEQQQLTAAALLAAGYDGDALALMRRTLNRPDRRGGNSRQPDQTEISVLVFYREMLKTETERYNEHLTWCTWGDWFKLQSARLENQREIWSVTSRAASTIVANNRLEWALRPYAIDTQMLEWYRGSLQEVMGPGVVSVELKRLLERTDAAGEREKPYLLAIKGEADAARGYPDLAIESLTSALKTLPDAEVMLKARITAVLGQCYERQGDMTQAVSCYRQVLEKAPHMFRELGIALPVQIETDGSAAGATAGGWLRHSPRFNDVGAGFVIRVTATGATLLYPDGTVFAVASVNDTGDAKSTARAICQEFHNRAFMPKLDLSQTDINSLDGSNMTGESNRNKLLEVFGVPTASPSASPSETP